MGRSSVFERASDKVDQSMSSGGSWNERLNMRFLSKIFTPDSPLFLKMGHIWELEAQL